MKIINNDLVELESHILLESNTRWVYEEKLLIEGKARVYLNRKYKSEDDMIYIDLFVTYLNNLDEDEIMELLEFSQSVYIKAFWEKYWSIAFWWFSSWLMEDWENYSDIINDSDKLNEYLLNKFNDIHKYYAKNHKYEIWKHIFGCMKNLWREIPNLWDEEYYEYWEKYYPIYEEC